MEYRNGRGYSFGSVESENQAFPGRQRVPNSSRWWRGQRSLGFTDPDRRDAQALNFHDVGPEAFRGGLLDRMLGQDGRKEQEAASNRQSSQDSMMERQTRAQEMMADVMSKRDSRSGGGMYEAAPMVAGSEAEEDPLPSFSQVAGEVAGQVAGHAASWVAGKMANRRGKGSPAPTRDEYEMPF